MSGRSSRKASRPHYEFFENLSASDAQAYFDRYLELGARVARDPAVLAR